MVSGFAFLGDHLKPSLQLGKADAQQTAKEAIPPPINISPEDDTAQPVGLTVEMRVAKKTDKRFVSSRTCLCCLLCLREKQASDALTGDSRRIFLNVAA
jgi:hypothetical protein